MYAQTKYHREIKTAVMGERTFTIKNLTPILMPYDLRRIIRWKKM